MHRLVFLIFIAGVLATSVNAGPLGYGDPTQPSTFGRPVVASSAPDAVVLPRWQLSSTIVAGQRRVAVINGRSVTPGARIDGAQLLAVDAGGAMIEHQGRRIRLELPRPAGKTITAKTPTRE